MKDAGRWAAVLLTLSACSFEPARLEILDGDGAAGGDSGPGPTWYEIDGSATDTRPGTATSSHVDGLLPGGAAARAPQLAVDGLGRPAVTWDTIDDTIETWWWLAGAWERLGPIDLAVGVSAPAIAFSPNNPDVLYVAWVQNLNELRLAQWSNGWVTTFDRADTRVPSQTGTLSDLRMVARDDDALGIIYTYDDGVIPRTAITIVESTGAEREYPGGSNLDGMIHPDITAIGGTFYFASEIANSSSPQIVVAGTDGTSTVTTGGADSSLYSVISQAGNYTRPRLGTDGTDLFVTWQHTALGETEVAAARYTPGGSWTYTGEVIDTGNGTGGIGSVTGPPQAHDLGALPPPPGNTGPRVFAAWMQQGGAYALDYVPQTDTWTAVPGALFDDGRVANAGGPALEAASGVFDDHFIVWMSDSTIRAIRYDCKDLWMDYADGANNGISKTDGCSEAPAMVMRNGTPIVAWHERITTNRWTIYLKSAAGGSWSELAGSATAPGLAPLGGSSGYPSIARGNGELWVVWHQVGAGNVEIVAKKLGENGVWAGVGGSDTLEGLSNTTDRSQFPDMVLLADGTPLVAWLEQDATGIWHPFARIYDSTLGWHGVHQSDVGTGLGNGGSALRPIRLGVDGAGTPYAAWVERNQDGSRDLYVKQWSANDGWTGVGGALGRVLTAGEIDQPAFAVQDDGTLHLAWRAKFPLRTQVFYKRYSPGGAWTEVGGSASGGALSDTKHHAIEPSITLAGAGRPAVAWAESGPGGWDIYLRLWNGSRWAEVDGSATGRGISATAAHSRQPVIRYGAGRLCVTWVDVGVSAPEIALRCVDVPPP